MPAFPLVECLERLAKRGTARSEADVQADVRNVLLYGGLSLADDQVVLLEVPVSGQRRIDVEAGFTVIEVKKDLRQARVLSRAVEQLAGYVADRSSATGQRYVGILTDGADWLLYHLVGEELHPVSTFTVDPAAPDADGLRLWLDGVLATSESIMPTPAEIERRLGASSTAYALDVAELTAIYRAHAEMSAVALKRELWGKLLRTAFGTSFRDEEALFVAHTLLVVMADVVGHAVIGIDPTDPTVTPATLLSGERFAQSQIGGVIEADFFDWPIETGEPGQRFVSALARRLSRFDWQGVEHDVMKILYESVISVTERHGLGEYYTPDWLAQETIGAVVENPLSTRVLDPACGSGTFLFWAVRAVLAAADEAGMSNARAVETACSQVLGVDVHPVAVTLARVTYLLALGRDRLSAPDRPPISVPVYLGDSVGWAASEATLFASDSLVVPTRDDARLFDPDALRFPERLLADAGRFDRLVNELADRATRRQPGSAVPSLAAVFRRYAIDPADQEELAGTFATLCGLFDAGRDHIWGYYTRNLARPAWLSRRENRVDALVGNPPWLAYRYMTASMQQGFRDMCSERGLWAGATLAASQDLSALFAVRSIERYLKETGRFGFVMPLASLSRQQFEGFRSGRYGGTTVAFEAAWDLHLVSPRIFRVPPTVVTGSRTTGGSRPLAGATEVWAGRLPGRNVSLDAAADRLVKTSADAVVERGAGSRYRERFAQGATMVPRMLVTLEPAPTSPLGVGAGRRAVRSRRTSNEKPPWKKLPPLSGSVEAQFVRPLHLGETVLPFRLKEPVLALVPWDGTRLIGADDDRIDLYPGLAEWSRRANDLWKANRSSDRLSLLERVDYRRGLSDQFPVAPHRVVYAASGMYMAAAYLSDTSALLEHSLYWAAVASSAEARYLVGVLNSAALTTALRPLQARGEHNPRHYDKYVFDVAIPTFDAKDPRHLRLAELAALAEAAASNVEVPERISFEAQRRRVREALAGSTVGQEIEAVVAELLGVS